MGLGDGPRWGGGWGLRRGGVRAPHYITLPPSLPFPGRVCPIKVGVGFPTPGKSKDKSPSLGLVSFQEDPESCLKPWDMFLTEHIGRLLAGSLLPTQSKCGESVRSLLGLMQHITTFQSRGLKVKIIFFKPPPPRLKGCDVPHSPCPGKAKRKTMGTFIRKLDVMPN